MASSRRATGRKEWERVHDPVKSLYVAGRSLEEVRETVRRLYGFEASTRSFRKQIAKWGLKKGVQAPPGMVLNVPRQARRSLKARRSSATNFEELKTRTGASSFQNKDRTYRSRSSSSGPSLPAPTDCSLGTKDYGPGRHELAWSKTLSSSESEPRLSTRDEFLIPLPHDDKAYGLEQKLLTNRDPVNQTEIHSSDSLHQAASSNSYTEVTSLLFSGFPVSNQTIDGDTPLHIAIRNHTDDHIIDLLLTHNADINIYNKIGLSAFHLLLQLSCLTCGFYLLRVKKFLHHGANIHFPYPDGTLPFAMFLDV
ncbi:hypothetical protein MMC17_008895 [Xylographa soralifera]|nr:hypothetical protein [Xylographa soralifera]